MSRTLSFRIARPARHTAIGPRLICQQCRGIQVSRAPTTTESPSVSDDAFGGSNSRATSAGMADARFEVLGAPYSLLSVTLSASQKLYTRRGTLVGVVGKAQNAQSTLTLLNPLNRALVGIPFLYQRVSSSTPLTALIATKSKNTTFTILHMDGTFDWMVTQRPALLAWTGHTLAASPRLQTGLSFSHWGNTLLTGRGLAAVAAPGQTYQVKLQEGEEFVAHPSHVVAYTVNKNPPRPIRFKGTSLRFEIPGTGWFNELEWVKKMRASVVYEYLAKAAFTVRTYARRWLFGDGLYLQFKGPITLLMSSRGVRVADMLTRDQVNEIADTEAGAVPKAIEKETGTQSQDAGQPGIKVEKSSQESSKASLEEGKELKEFVR
ncbi:altered inheritance 24 [Zalerion maritima]|uniref:Altered inheritance of mitochondria protein 24, mitochondrial n=1 Tax=Zalerion maritima TaxID=339359 RepID=A0AAD5RRF0_9PEZI|nr:altered inheritance 24 [Zalerion maritima]